MVDREKEKRGSEKLLAAWKARAVTEESVREIGEALDKSPARVEGAEVVGGGSPTAVRLSLRYDGDGGAWCGNDILFWFRWHFKHGGGTVPPRILIDGTPWPDLVRLDLTFGHAGPDAPAIPDVSGPLGGGIGG